MIKFKKGTHVGVIISFMIFVTFLFFLYAIVQPGIETRNEKQAPLDSLEREVLSEISTSLTTVSVFVNIPVSICFILENFITKTRIDENIIVIDYSGTTFNSYVNGPDLIIDTGGSDLLLKVRVSEEFDLIGLGGPVDCTNVNENVYTVGLIKTKEHVFSSKMENLIALYNAGYSTTKDLLKVSSDSDFGLGFTYNNGTVIKTREINVSAGVYAKDISVQYINDDANEVSGIINIKIW